MTDPEQLPIFDSGIQWNKHTSKGGKSFAFALEKADDSSEEDSKPAMAGVFTSEASVTKRSGGDGEMAGELTCPAPVVSIKSSGRSRNTSVDGPVGDKTWKDCSANNISISRYRLYKNSWSIWDYKLDFTNTTTATFTFKDDTDDYYEVVAARNGDHSLRYNSKGPRIVWAG